MQDSHRVRVRVSADWACFTRPEMKVERVSYPVMTPSAARGVLEAILWKPEMRWIVESIGVLRPIEFYSIRRNEVQSKISPGAIGKWMKNPETFEPLMADFMGDGEDRSERTQRNTLALRSVSYLIQARVLLTSRASMPRTKLLDADEDPSPNTEIKYVSMFNRRVEKGQCWQRPYLGCREFAADFCPSSESDRSIEETRDLGLMLYDIVYGGKKANRPIFFNARLEQGTLHCDPDHVLTDENERKGILSC